MADPNVTKTNRVKSNDRLIHESLSKIFRERRLNSDEIKEFLRTPEDSDHNSIMKLIMKQNPYCSKLLSDRNCNDVPLLSIAVLVDYLDTIELLVRSGVDVNQTYTFKDVGPEHIDETLTALDLLINKARCSPEHERLCYLIIEHGADLRIRNHMGETALNQAVHTSMVQLTKTILEKGVDVDVACTMNVNQRGNGLTPLLVAAKHKVADELVPLLMEYGADVFVKDSYGRNALHSLTLGPVELVDIARVLIEKGVSLDDRMNIPQYQPIHLAAINGKQELLKLYLDHGADVNALAEDDEFPLFLAAEDDHSAVVKTLLERGANIDLRTSDKSTALHNACWYYCEESVRLLLSAGADVLAEDEDGETPFARIDIPEVMENLGICKLVIKALALKKAGLPSIEIKDETIIGEHPVLWSYYQDCRAHISRMKFTRLVGSCTFYELLAKSHCRIVELMRNPDFEANFELYDLDGFSMYAEDVRRAFERAQNDNRSMLKLERIIDEADVHNIFPWIIVRRVAHHILYN